MIPTYIKSRSHRRSSSTSNVHAYNDDDYHDYLQPRPLSSTHSPAKKLITSMKRSLSHSKTRRRDLDSQLSPPLSPSPYASSPSHYRYQDPSTVPSSSPPTLEQIAMGLHISRTPHLRPLTVGVRGRGGPSAGRPSSARVEVAQVYYSPYISPSGSTAPGTPSHSHSQSSSRLHSHTYPDPRRIPMTSAHPVPPLPQRSASLPPPPARSSLKRSSKTPSILPSPGLASATGSVASTSTESSLSTTKSSVRGRSLMALSLKARMGWFLGGKLAKGKEIAPRPSLDTVEVATAKKAVRFDDSSSIAGSHEEVDDQVTGLSTEKAPAHPANTKT